MSIHSKESKLNQGRYIEDQDLAEDFARERAQDSLGIRKVKKDSDLKLHKNKIVAYLDDNLSYAQRREVEEKLGESRELFAYYEEKKDWLDNITNMIPEAMPSQLATEQIELELYEVAENIFSELKSESPIKKIASIFTRK